MRAVVASGSVKDVLGRSLLRSLGYRSASQTDTLSGSGKVSIAIQNTRCGSKVPAQLIKPPDSAAAHGWGNPHLPPNSFQTSTHLHFSLFKTHNLQFFHWLRGGK